MDTLQLNANTLHHQAGMPLIEVAKELRIPVAQAEAAIVPRQKWEAELMLQLMIAAEA